MTWGRSVVRIHPGLLDIRKGFPMGDGTRLEAGGALTRPCGFNSRSFRSTVGQDGIQPFGTGHRPLEKACPWVVQVQFLFCPLGPQGPRWCLCCKGSYATL